MRSLLETLVLLILGSRHRDCTNGVAPKEGNICIGNPRANVVAIQKNGFGLRTTCRVARWNHGAVLYPSTRCLASMLHHEHGRLLILLLPPMTPGKFKCAMRL